MKDNKLATLDDVGKSYISRSIACATLITKDDMILCVKRGEAVDETDKWSIPCGYLGWGETTTEAAFRELYEETGIKLKSIDEHFITCYVDDDPKSNKRQNVTFVYSYKIFENIKLPIENIEEFSNGEIKEVKWVSYKDIDKYKWAFNTKDLISKLYF